jgi:hypothetical protein
MESLVHRRLQVILVALLALAAVGVVPAFAEDPPYTDPVNVTVDSGPDSVTVDATQTGTDPGVSGTGTQASGGSGPKCYLREVDNMDEDLTLEYFRRRMQYAPYYVICDGDIKSIVWILIPDSGSGSPGGAVRDPADVARELRDRIPIPRVTVDINPGRGLVGVESWFWIDGYDGRPITNSTDAFGDLVQVEAQVTRYEWSFGDGATFVGESPGRAYPQRSDVHHVYQRSSAGLPDGYTVVVDFVFAVRYRVNRGAWIELPGITRTSQANYPVRESQAVIDQ